MKLKSIIGIFFCLVVCLAPTASPTVSPTAVVELTPQDLARLNRSRMLIQRYLSGDDARGKYQTVPGKLGTLRAIMKIEPLRPARKDLLEAMGVVLGDTFVQDMGFRWVVIENESGRRVVIRYRRRNLFLYPLTMIAERLQRREPIDVLDLYNEVAADAEEAIDAGSR